MVSLAGGSLRVLLGGLMSQLSQDLWYLLKLPLGFYFYFNAKGKYVIKSGSVQRNEMQDKSFSQDVGIFFFHYEVCLPSQGM
jgi:hypothetical protein